MGPIVENFEFGFENLKTPTFRMEWELLMANVDFGFENLRCETILNTRPGKPCLFHLLCRVFYMMKVKNFNLYFVQLKVQRVIDRFRIQWGVRRVTYHRSIFDFLCLLSS